MIYVFTKKSASLKTALPKNVSFVNSPLSEHSPENGDISYIDVSGFSDAELKKTLAQLKKICCNTHWGIIDPKGSVKDIAELFFEGACDYLGPGLLKSPKGVDAKHFKSASQWRKVTPSAGPAGGYENAAVPSAGAGFLKSGIKLPAASAFPGWKKMETGKNMPFYLLYCSLQGKTALDSRLNDKTLNNIHKNFLSLLSIYMEAGDGLLWMNTGRDCLFLFPPRAKSAEAAIKACVGMIVSAPLFVLETFGISIPANFIFAMHYGTITYKPPGKTGTIVSDAVNSIFHLGAKKSEPGRLTISGELPDVSIPPSLQDLFVPAGEYEGRKIWQTKKFTYAKPWY
ncbi:MAG: hypothetical protein LBV17_11930 [Treponema sp.]|jgi:hypothetical protein|nr:hypothetical protein [Treponema sp.]